MHTNAVQFDRRQFIKQLAMLGAGLTLAPGLTASEQPLDANQWALISDPHIAADLKSVRRDVNMADHLAQIVSEILKQPQLPGHILVTGDLSSISGQAEDYAAVFNILKPLNEAKLPLHVIPGNHDDRKHLAEAYPVPTEKPVLDRYVNVLKTKTVNWILLDSSINTNTSNGALGEAQRVWLTRELDAAPNTPTIIALHHPPNGIAPALDDSKAFWEIVRPRPQVKACIYGHTHAYKTAVDESGIHLVNLPAASYAFEPNTWTGWVLATVSSDSMRLELRCTDKKNAANGKVCELQFRKTELQRE